MPERRNAGGFGLPQSAMPRCSRSDAAGTVRGWRGERRVGGGCSRVAGAARRFSFCFILGA